MAWARKKSGGRKEPQFGLGASLSELRLSPQDRVANAEAEKPKKSSSKAKTSDPEEEEDAPAPRERKPRPARASRKRRSSARARSGLFRLFYWGAVLGL